MIKMAGQAKENNNNKTKMDKFVNKVTDNK